MPKRKGRGRGVGRLRAARREKFQGSEDDNLDIPLHPLGILEVDGGFGFEVEQEADTSTMPKRKRLGEPRGSTVRNKFQESADDNSAIPPNPLNLADEGPGRGEDLQQQEADAGNAQGQGRPSGSRVQKMYQESAGGNLDALISNIVGEVIGRLEQEAGKTPTRKGRGRPKGSTSLKKFHRSADGNMNIIKYPSNLVEVGAGFEEEQQEDTDATPKKKGRGRPKGSMGKKIQESADGNSGISINQSNLQEVDHGRKEEQEAVTNKMPMRRGRGRPKGSTAKQMQPQNADGKLDVLNYIC